MAIKIIWATNNDLKDLVCIDQMAHKENKFWDYQSRKNFEKVLKTHKFSTLIARDNDNPIGYLQSGERNTKRHVWIENIFVIKKYRKKGVAKLLVNKFIKYWKKHATHIVLITEDKNLKIFKRLGFEKEMNYMGYKFVEAKKK